MVRMRTTDVLLAGMLMLAACGRAESVGPQQLPVQALDVAGHDGVQHLRVEIADDDQERETGLMYRRQMADDAGMLFVWPEAAPRSFWMRNTYIPLDMIYVRAGRIMKVIPWAKPLDESSLPSDVPVDMVLEVNGGWASKRHVGVGDRIELKK